MNSSLLRRRFLHTEVGGKSFEVGDERAWLKTSQTLREGIINTKAKLQAEQETYSGVKKSEHYNQIIANLSFFDFACGSIRILYDPDSGLSHSCGAPNCPLGSAVQSPQAVQNLQSASLPDLSDINTSHDGGNNSDSKELEFLKKVRAALAPVYDLTPIQNQNNDSNDDDIMDDSTIIREGNEESSLKNNHESIKRNDADDAISNEDDSAIIAEQSCRPKKGAASISCGEDNNETTITRSLKPSINDWLSEEEKSESNQLKDGNVDELSRYKSHANILDKPNAKRKATENAKLDIKRAMTNHSSHDLRSDAEALYMINTNFTIDTVIDELLYAHSSNFLALKQASINFIVNHIDGVLESSSYDRLVLQSTELTKEIMRAVSQSSKKRHRV